MAIHSTTIGPALLLAVPMELVPQFAEVMRRGMNFEFGQTQDMYDLCDHVIHFAAELAKNTGNADRDPPTGAIPSL